MVSPMGQNVLLVEDRIVLNFCILKAEVKVSSMEPMFIGLGKFTDRVNLQNVILISIDE